MLFLPEKVFFLSLESLSLVIYTMWYLCLFVSRHSSIIEFIVFFQDLTSIVSDNIKQDKEKRYKTEELIQERPVVHYMRIICNQNTVFLLFFFCKSKEDYEEEDVEEVVYKDSSHFLKVKSILRLIINNCLFDMVKNTSHYPGGGLNPDR